MAAKKLIMNRSLIFVAAILILITGCEKTDNDVFLKFSDGHEYGFGDIELYDTSAHMIYFRDVHEEFTKIENGTFMLYYKGEPVYMGSFWPGYSSLGPKGPFIMTPTSCNYALKINNWHSDKQDIRNDSKLLKALTDHGLLHSGLSISSGSVIISGTHLTFRFTVKNMDESDLLIIDPEKTGLNLFHYFTNGLYIYDMAYHEVFSGNIVSEVPQPYNAWKAEWLSLLKSGATRDYSINYTLPATIVPGVYLTTFNFPGLHYQVTRDQLYQGSTRIWLGDVSYKGRLVIQ
jgi:hypothetical protein